MSGPDRTYTNLLAQLHTSNPSLPISTIQNALAHYLAHLGPRPTPLAATAVSSMFYLVQPFTHEKLQSFLTAFRYAAHLKYRTLTEDAKARSRIGSLFTRSVQGGLHQWIDDIVEGIQGGHSVLRLSSLTGLLIGINDIEAQMKHKPNHSIDLIAAKHSVEGELVVAVAEVIDTCAPVPSSSSPSDSNSENKPVKLDILPLSLVIASQSLPLVSDAHFKILPLSTLVQLAMASISTAFYSGAFLHTLNISIKSQPDHKICIPPESPVAMTLHYMSSSPITASIAPLSRLAAKSLRALLEGYSTAKLVDGLRAASEALGAMRSMTARLEEDWSASRLAVVQEKDIEPQSQQITMTIWTSLKTLLFSTVMISEAILSCIIYIPRDLFTYPASIVPSPSSLALLVLHVFSHLSFIISQFGGVTSSSQGFDQLKKTFYLALDILAQGENKNDHNNLANTYVKEQCVAFQSSTIAKAPKSIQMARKALVLAGIEQLVPVLNENCVKNYVFELCYPFKDKESILNISSTAASLTFDLSRHLSDPSHKETFESAHSVILAVFASHAQKQQQRYSKSSFDDLADVRKSGKKTDDSHQPDDFIRKMVPFYAQCLLENSGHGGLSTPQLRLAFSALVKSAGASVLNVLEPSEESLSLAWYCVQMLLEAIHSQMHIQRTTTTTGYSQHLQRLLLTLISTVPSLPLPLMIRVLDKIKLNIQATPIMPNSKGGRTRDELVEALFTEILERVGYRERNTAMQWWYQNRMDL